MIILGIDPGTARMGYGVVEVYKTKNKLPKLLEADTLITKPDLGMPQRLRFIYKRLSEIVEKYSPDVMVIEKLFFNTNAKTAISVGQARGISILAASSKKDLVLYEYTALEAKKTLTDYGRADKKQMQEAVKEILNLGSVVKSDDANDGVAMALCFIKKELKNLWHLSE